MKAEVIRAGVMGWPIEHSRSPILHGTWLKRYNVAGTYERLAVPPEQLEAALRGLAAQGFAGVNLTVPHKEAAVKIVDHLDDAARRIGSVNTVTVLPDGTLEGRSTDGYGFMQNLVDQAPGRKTDTGPVTIIGAGGAARAIAAALIESGETDIRLVNRTHDRAELLAAELGPELDVWPWVLRHVAVTAATLLVNTTTRGMGGQEPLDLDLALLPKSAVVVDIVYTPLETPLLAAARARGNPVVDGLGMLLHQARPAFARWFGIDPAVDDHLRDTVLATLVR